MERSVKKFSIFHLAFVIHLLPGVGEFLGGELVLGTMWIAAAITALTVGVAFSRKLQFFTRSLIVGYCVLAIGIVVLTIRKFWFL